MTSCVNRLCLKQQKKKNQYDFSDVFCKVKDLFDASDFVIANLETPLAGEELGYTHSLFSFNSPDELADAIKAAGIDMVTTANNHCLDRGVTGLLRTMAVLDEKHIPYSGTSQDNNNRSAATTFSLGECKAALVSYTYGTNFISNRVILEKHQKDLINLLRPQEERYYITDRDNPQPLFTRAVNKLMRPLRSEYRYAIKKALHMQYNQAHEDNNLNEKTAEPYMEKLFADIEYAKKTADLVFFYPHIGGQFNSKPGAFTEYVFSKALQYGANAIIASHTHVVQKAKYISGTPCFYSIGNFSMSPNSVYLLHDNHPEYGLAVHFYIDNNKIQRCTFSVLKMIEEKRQMLCVWPTDLLFASLRDTQKRRLFLEVSEIVFKVSGRKIKEIRSEYELSIDD